MDLGAGGLHDERRSVSVCIMFDRVNQLTCVVNDRQEHFDRLRGKDRKALVYFKNTIFAFAARTPTKKQFSLLSRRRNCLVIFTFRRCLDSTASVCRTS